MADTDSPDGRVPLLGQLAGEGWFMNMGEIAVTKSLTWLASDPELRTAILAHLGMRANIDLTGVDQLVPESVHDDRSRPDIEMLDTDGRIIALVEAKFDAHLTDGQVAAYLEILNRRSGPHRGALFVLVPSSRVDEAQRTLQRTISTRAEAAAHAVITWDEWLNVWADVAEQTSDAALANDLRQLRAMCQTLGGGVIPPLAETTAGRDWQERASDLVKIVNVVTARFLGSLGPRDLPMQGNLVSKPWTYRYLPEISQETWVQVGVWGRFADEGLTPFWLMLHKDDKGSGGFQTALQRLLASELSRKVRRDDGHAWVPLEVPSDASGPELVDALETKVGAVLGILRL
ncbi:PD-(D/E)XK nuclease family protein [Nocardiopsis quinghaiensis]|uniref:PD-(D/E)XK nuclease family protein n=1 Tax=Nocardiopsis quinghaiensis TaxID=464995 RepID=UPI001680B544|nr:PD-(D/E)XK nuclease family protein [Nocardiopsis quinghaiensis]